MRFRVWLLISLTFFQCSHAALPPLYQTANEIKTILMSEELGKYLTSADAITKIEKIDNGYEITTNYHRLVVEVQNEPMGRPGPIQFNLKFQQAQPLK